jgi:cardiolipin synthase
METYIYQSDKAGRRFGAALMERARAGVTVRLLIDAVGSVDMEQAYVEELKAAGVRLATFRPFSWKAGLGFNRRDHRKILVVDGRVGFTGGLNIGDEYAAVEDGGGGWHDMHARVEGPVVAEMARLFRRTWLAAGGDRYPQIEEPAAESVATESTAFAIAVGNEEMRRRATIRRFYLHAMRRARESIQIMNAYFIPDRGIRRVMANAVKRGVKVSVIVPEKNDLKSVQFAGHHVFAKLLRAGVRIFEWPERMLHAKTAVVDTVWATIGSYNLDARSLFHNLEVVLCIVDRGFAAGVAAQLEHDAGQSKEILLERWNERPWWRKVAEWFFYQFRHWL